MPLADYALMLFFLRAMLMIRADAPCYILATIYFAMMPCCRFSHFADMLSPYADTLACCRLFAIFDVYAAADADTLSPPMTPYHATPLPPLLAADIAACALMLPDASC